MKKAKCNLSTMTFLIFSEYHGGTFDRWVRGGEFSPVSEETAISFAGACRLDARMRHRAGDVTGTRTGNPKESISPVVSPYLQNSRIRGELRARYFDFK